MELGIGSRVRNEEFGVGVVIQNTSADHIITFVNHGIIKVSKEETEKELEILEKVEPKSDLISLSQVEISLKKLLANVTDEIEEVELGEKWIEGIMILAPKNKNLKPYELPLDIFFHKIVMVRDRIRVMEQRINSSNLSESEKIQLQQYITRIYGSLTSFNVLFKHREDSFVGSGGH